MEDIQPAQEKTVDEKIASLDSLSTLLDSQFSFLGFRFGVDAVIGLVPGIGDMAGGIVSLLIIARARHLGVREAAVNKMIRNVLIDVFVGSIPLLGDAFDFFFKTNERNMRIAKKDLHQQVAPII